GGLNLDAVSVRSSKLKGLVKGAMIGFKFTHFPATESAAPEVRKFQVKFRSTADCGQCAAVLTQFIECRTMEQSANPTPASASTLPVVAHAPSPAALMTAVNSNIGSGLNASHIPFTPGKQSVSQMLSTPSQSMQQSQTIITLDQDHQGMPFSPLNITPRFGSQPWPVLSSSAASDPALAPTPAPTSAPSLASASALPASLLHMSDGDLERDIDNILRDPNFAEMLVRVNAALGGDKNRHQSRQ
ncbi:hypothetical protein BGZ54_004359, partial [Gamsiella multidivaricata]